MTWYVFSLIALVASTAASLSQKWALNLKFNKQLFLIYAFTGFLLAYFLYDFSELKALVVQGNLYVFLFWSFMVAATSMAANISQIKAVDKSPNPGYVMAIISANALLILILSLLFFKAPITWLKFVGILVALIGFFVLLVEKVETKKKGPWQIPAILAMLFYAAMILIVKKITDFGFSPAQILLGLFFFAAPGFWLIALAKKTNLKLGEAPKIAIVPLLLFIGAGFIGNLTNFMAIKLVSNPGYSTAVFNSSVVLT